MNNKREFQFTLAALKLLGKNLYSNPWAAISELVANGLDASATKVSVFVDARNKSEATIQIMDNGCGMTDKDIDTYLQIGYNKRKFYHTRNSHAGTQNVMGRKGIGKLAALYLSDNYYIKTKTKDNTSIWQLDIRNQKEDTHPFLLKTDNLPVNVIDTMWDNTACGTLLVLTQVNLKGLGPIAFDSLSHYLANHFLSSSMPNITIALGVATSDAEYNQPSFKPVEKQIAFRNLSIIFENYLNNEDEPSEIKQIKDSGTQAKVSVPIHGLNSTKELNVQISQFADVTIAQGPKYKGIYTTSLDNVDQSLLELIKHKNNINIDNNTIDIPYCLTGWIGLHSTIEQKYAKMNDPKFTKSKLYNPCQIRLYVRNKLAAEDVLKNLGLTQAFTNYIEGEISFNLLDEDFLPDIATSSRQGYNQLDERWTLLTDILRSIVRKLITYRDDLTKKLKDEENSRKSRAKGEAISEFSTLINTTKEIPPDVKPRIISSFASQLEGDVIPKQQYKVFLSHSSKDRIFTDFIYKLLEHKGATKEDFFYTSADDDTEKYESLESLEKQIKLNITDQKTLILFLSSPSFKKSQYCLFEAGAGWATRSIDEYRVMGIRYKDIPQYLTNGKTEFAFMEKDSGISLDKRVYGYLVILLNALITHINKSRCIKGAPTIPLFVQPQFPDDVQMRKTGKCPRDYMDDDIVQYWDEYVNSQLEKYLSNFDSDN